MRELAISKGMVALVDDEDYDRCRAHKWYASWGSRAKKWYVKRRTRKSEMHRWQCAEVRLHHFILDIAPCELPPGHVVDHVNHNSLDCRKFIDGRVQLEVVTQSENMLRSPRWKRAGVTWDTEGNNVPAMAAATADRSDEW